MVFTERSTEPEAHPGNVPSTEDLVSAFMAVMGRLTQHFFQRSAEFDFSGQQAKAFHELGEPRSMGELADRLFCDASNVTGIVDRLEARGLVERQADPDDRRVRRLVLTDAGRELWQAHHDRVFDGVPCLTNLTDDDRRVLCDLLRRMAGDPGGSTEP
ncbi:MAG: MarR family transcriptional regulator, organic hydroperoxide resistance regulator [Actinomycetota bacterium]|jgi:DNA-binding MarR family transcriptional regulator|nr:MarR family transcriptional regulator, organic hydroperoxide resistance regulator [Actinomycetota bacterium]